MNGRLLGEYVSSGIRRGLNPDSLNCRLGSMASLARFIEPRGLLDARQVDIEAWLATRRSTPSTQRWHLANLSSFYAWAVRVEQIDVNPTVRIDRPRQRRHLPRPIEEADLVAALAEADVRTRCWLMLAAYEGLRVSEIALLRREAVLDRRHPPLLLVERGKGGHQRVLPLNRLSADAGSSHGPVVVGAMRVRQPPPSTRLGRLDAAAEVVRDLGVA